MIFGLFGCPRFGVAGAAYATVLGQSIAAILGLFMNLKFNPDIRISWGRILRPDAYTVSRIYVVGVPSILMMSIGSVMTYGMNMILTAFSTTATAVFGVYFKLQSFFFMPVFGLNNGLIPVLAYNYGARQKERIDEALKFSFGVAVVIMLCGTAIMNLFPDVLLGFFNADEAMLQIGIPADRYPRSADHQPVLPAGCHRDHLGLHLPGIFPEYLLPDHLPGQTAGRPAAGRMASLKDRRRHQRLVGLPHR